MKAFITGISGFAGKHLSDFLSTRNIETSGIGLTENFEGNQKINYYQIDILDQNKVEKVINEVKPDIIFHLAGISSVSKSFEQPDLCKKINVIGTKNLLDAVVSSKTKPKILVIGSAEVYGSKSFPVDETTELDPRSPYALSKKEQEDLCRKYMEDLHIVISRSFAHIGPGQKPMFVTSNFAKQIAEVGKGKEAVIKVGNLDAKRDFTDVRDMVRAYHLALEKGNAGECYNICSGKMWSVKELLDQLLSLSDINIKVETDPEKMRPTDIPIQVGNNSKFRTQTGWNPKIPLRTTLRDLLDYWRQKVDSNEA
jgi:GDP-4-dehydro-6-deoxy-D-mannose reductase